jgi:hypothetical protein
VFGYIELEVENFNGGTDKNVEGWEACKRCLLDSTHYFQIKNMGI